MGLGNTGAWGLLHLKLSGSWSRHRRDPQDAQSSALAVSTPGQGGARSLCSVDGGPGKIASDLAPPSGTPSLGFEGNYLPGGVGRGLSEAIHSLWEGIFHCVKISRLSVGSV